MSIKQVYITLEAPEKFVKLGDFNLKVRDQSMSIYYNMDLGDHRTEMFDLNRGIKKMLK